MAFDKKNNRSLRRKIFARIVPSTVLMFVLTSWWTFQYISTNFSDEVSRRVEANSINFSKTAGSRLEEAANAISLVANNDLVINGIVDMEFRESAMMPFFRSLVLPGPPDQIVMMTDYRGKPLITNRRSAKGNEFTKLGPMADKLVRFKEVWDDAVLNQGKRFVGSSEDWIIVASPVLYSNQPEGAVVSIYPVHSFFDKILDTSDSTVMGIAVDGVIVASANDDIMQQGAPSSQVPDTWISSTSQVPGLPRVSTVVFESERTISSASTAVIVAMSTYFVVLLIGVSLAFVSSTYMLTNPLDELARHVLEVEATGDLSLRVDEIGPRETASLSSAFNRMLAKLDKTTVSKESYRKLAYVAKHTDNAVVITDPQGKIDWVNDGFTRITGYELDEAVGRSPGSLLQGPKTNQETAQLMRDAIKNQEGFDVEIVNYDKQGNPYWIAIESRPILNDDGEIDKFIAIETNITERKNAEQEKEKLSRELQDSARSAGMAEIATGVLHNVGNVLNSVNVTTALLMDTCRNSRLASLIKTRELLEQNKSNLADFLTNDERGKKFLDFFHLLVEQLEQENKLSLNELVTLEEHIKHIKETIAFQQSYAKKGGMIEPVDLSKTISSVLRMQEETFRKYNIQVKCDLDESLTLNLNKHKLLQVLLNIVANAGHALRDSGKSDLELRVSLRKVGDKVEIAVTDNGIGIPEDNLEVIFVHGFTTKEDGHGFGLHSSALAAQEIGGTLTVSSPGEGKGATFTIHIPYTSRDSLNKTIFPASSVTTPGQASRSSVET